MIPAHTICRLELQCLARGTAFAYLVQESFQLSVLSVGSNVWNSHGLCPYFLPQSLSLIIMLSNDDAGRIHRTSFMVCMTALLFLRPSFRIADLIKIYIGHIRYPLYHRFTFRSCSYYNSISLSKTILSRRCLFIFWNRMPMRLHGSTGGIFRNPVPERSAHNTIPHNTKAVKFAAAVNSIP